MSMNRRLFASKLLALASVPCAASADIFRSDSPQGLSAKKTGKPSMKKKDQIPDSRIAWPPENSPAVSGVFAQNIVDIAAPPDKVWSLLIDCVKWPQWYKHCTDVSILRGGLLLGVNSKFRFKTLNLYFEPEIRTFEPSRMLVWSAKGPLGGSGAHAWYIEPTPGGCRVVTEETQRGILSALLGWYTRQTLLTSHEEWLRALKALAEAK